MFIALTMWRCTRDSQWKIPIVNALQLGQVDITRPPDIGYAFLLIKICILVMVQKSGKRSLEVGNSSHYLHPRWLFGISSINSIAGFVALFSDPCGGQGWWKDSSSTTSDLLDLATFEGCFAGVQGCHESSCESVTGSERWGHPKCQRCTVAMVEFAN